MISAVKRAARWWFRSWNQYAWLASHTPTTLRVAWRAGLFQANRFSRGKSHRELYSVQYADPRVGRKARLVDAGDFTGRVVTIQRFVSTRFGLLMICEEFGGEKAFAKFELVEA